MSTIEAELETEEVRKHDSLYSRKTFIIDFRGWESRKSQFPSGFWQVHERVRDILEPEQHVSKDTTRELNRLAALIRIADKVPTAPEEYDLLVEASLVLQQICKRNQKLAEAFSVGIKLLADGAPESEDNSERYMQSEPTIPG